MSQLTDTTIIANDPVLRFTPDGTPVINLSLPCEYGKKGQDGKKPTQWLDASIWGKRAEALAPYLVKRQLIAFTVDDVHNEEYQSGNENRTKLVGRISHIKLVGGSPANQGQPAQHSNHGQPAQSSQAPANSPADFDEFNDSIPF